MEETLKKYRKGEKAAAKIMIEVARDRVALDARSEAQQERIRRQAEQERQRQEEKLKKANVTIIITFGCLNNNFATVYEKFL